jgi:3-dehydro-4-phosphotetronate decarboxylase
MTEHDARHALAAVGRSLCDRGYGSAGNLSVRLEEGGFLVTPTGVSLGRLDPHALSRLDSGGHHASGPRPTREACLHLAMYRARPDATAVAHLHSTYAVALSCRTDRPPDDMVPALMPYSVIRLGRVPLIPYSAPGEPSRSVEITALAREHCAVLLANHGPVVSGPTLHAAVVAAEELEEAARLFFLLEGRPHRTLTPEQVDHLRRAFAGPLA